MVRQILCRYLQQLRGLPVGDGERRPGAVRLMRRRRTVRAARLSPVWIVLLLCLFIADLRADVPVDILYDDPTYHDYWVRLQGRDGFVYGTGSDFRSFGTSFVFRVRSDSALTILATFPGSEVRSLIEGSDGSVYGTTSYPFFNDLASPITEPPSSTIFRLSPTGQMTVLHEFSSEPIAPGTFFEAVDGTLYGATGRRIFKLTKAGAFEVIHTFVRFDGQMTLAEG